MAQKTSRPWVPAGWRLTKDILYVEPDTLGGWDLGAIDLYQDPQVLALCPISGPTWLDRMQNLQHVSAAVLDFAMRNIKKIPTTWRQDENGEPIYIHFLGSEYLNECYEVCVRCAYFYKGGLYQRALNVAKNPVYHGYRAARWRHGHRPAFAT